jgi:hypothetical protein
MVLGNTNDEVVRISARFPILALFLSITNINKRPDNRQNPGQGQKHCASVFLGPYGYVDVKQPISISSGRWSNYITLILVHIITGTGAGVVIYQTIELGRKAVVSWACWTDWYPVLWIGIGLFHHVLSVICMRLSLRIRQYQPTSGKDPQALSASAATRTGMSVWELARQPSTVIVLHKRFARWSKALTDLINNFNYLYGTAVFSSLTLVSGNNAIKNLSIYGGKANWVVGS